MSDSDPRVFFAAERTLLAWLRTGLTLIALGFVVSRFGLFVRLLAMQSQASAAPSHASLSVALGVAFVVAGTLAIVTAAAQHQRFVATSAAGRPAAWLLPGLCRRAVPRRRRPGPGPRRLSARHAAVMPPNPSCAR